MNTTNMTNGDWPECSPYITLNLSYVWAASTLLYSTTENIFFVVGVPVLITIGLLTNAAFIFTVIRVKSMHTITNAYLMNVSFADLMFIIVGAGLYLFNYLSSPVRFDVPYKSWVGCTVAFGITYIMYSTSLVLITLVCVERYCAICRPLQLRRVSSKNRTVKLILISWFVGILLAACVVPRYGGHLTYCVVWPRDESFDSFPRMIHFCVAAHPDIYLFSEALNIVPFTASMFGSIFMYGHIISTLSNRPATSSQNNVRRTTAVRNQVARLLIINGTLFFVCQAPFRIASVHNLLEHHTGEGLFSATQYSTLLLITRCLLFINTCVNPIVFVITSSFYRYAFFEAFGCKSKTGETETNMSSVSHRTTT